MVFRHPPYSFRKGKPLHGLRKRQKKAMQHDLQEIERRCKLYDTHVKMSVDEVLDLVEVARAALLHAYSSFSGTTVDRLVDAVEKFRVEP